MAQVVQWQHMAVNKIVILVSPKSPYFPDLSIFYEFHISMKREQYHATNPNYKMKRIRAFGALTDAARFAYAASMNVIVLQM